MIIKAGKMKKTGRRRWYLSLRGVMRRMAIKSMIQIGAKRRERFILDREGLMEWMMTVP